MSLQCPVLYEYRLMLFFIEPVFAGLSEPLNWAGCPAPTTLVNPLLNLFSPYTSLIPNVFLF